MTVPTGSEVVITGAGVCGPFGDERATWEALAGGRSAIRMVDVPGVAGFPQVPGAPWLAESPVPFLTDRKLAKYMSPASTMAVVAAGRALRAASLLDDTEAKSTLGLFVATGLIAFDLSAVERGVELSRTDDGELDMRALGERGLRACHPLMPFKMLLNMSLGLVSIAYGLRGANFVTYPDASQAGICLERAVRAIRTGQLERALVGGTSQGLSLMPVCTRSADRALARDVAAACPFGLAHAGQAPADAAAFLVVERAGAARARGHTPLAVLGNVSVGWSPEGEAEPILGGESPDLWVTTGSRSYAQDRAELAALDTAWPGGAPRVVSYDGAWGDTGAASVALCLGAATEMLDEGAWPMPWQASDGDAPARLLTSNAAALRPRSIAVRATNGTGGVTMARLSSWDGRA